LRIILHAKSDKGVVMDRQQEIARAGRGALPEVTP
jgi:hypothetical protein